ncbi:MAG: hypothetical protein SWY16_16810 [Cyanobacteriota bacterium]|nr:hypothetical protein [Cyanobacteriota bacterium]
MKPNFETMSKAELRAYAIAHQNDKEAFEALVDRLTAQSSSETYTALMSPEEIQSIVFEKLGKDFQENRIIPPNLQEAETLLASLFEEVKTWEGTLAGGTKLNVGGTAIDRLRQTQVCFGNPRDSLILLTEETFQEVGVELSHIVRQQMRDGYNFYYMTVSVDIRPQPGACFRQLCCELDFSPKGENEPIVHTIFPKSQWRTVMNLETGMDLGLNENLDWNIGLDTSNVALLEKIPGNLKANVTSKSKLKALVAIPNYAYDAGRFDIVAQGKGNSTCYWYIQEPDLLKLTTVQFAIVFKVPQNVKSIGLRGTVWAEPSINWLTAEIRDVFSELADRFKNLLRRKDEVASQFSRGDAEEWTLRLPQATANL